MSCKNKCNEICISTGCKRGHRGHRGSTGFQGPQGITGVQGPQGPISNSVYGYIWDNATIEQIILPSVSNYFSDAQTVNFSSYGPLNGVIFNGTNSLIVSTSGDYEAEYNIIASPEFSDLMSFKLVKEHFGIPNTIPGSITYGTKGSDNLVSLSGNVKFSAQAGDTIKLANNTAENIILQPAPGNVNSIIIGNHSYVMGNTTTAFTSSPIIVSTGSSVYASIQVGRSATVSNVIDNEGNVYTKAISSVNGSIETEIWYIDNVIGSGYYTITAVLTSSANIIIEVVELKGTAIPSLNFTSSSMGTDIIASSTVTTNVFNEFGLLSIVAENIDGIYFSSVPPDFVIDGTSKLPVGPDSIAGADIGQFFFEPNTYTMSTRIFGGLGPVNYAVAAVSIKPKSDSIFTETPLNASLGITLLNEIF